jgi:glutaredoxin
MVSFVEPSSVGYTIYSKTGCTYCTKVKLLLTGFELPYTIVNCDEYLLENKEKFLDFIKTKAEKEYKTFPMVFLEGKFIGGFMETKASIDINSDND